VKHDLRFKPWSVKDLKKLPAELRRQIIEKVEGMAEDSAGDVKQLTNFTPEYRLRLGTTVFCSKSRVTQSLFTAFGIAGKRIDEGEATNDRTSPANYREGWEGGIQDDRMIPSAIPKPGIRFASSELLTA
jgi:mRNA-degrading endonuclease RelE of RelBE toxin-antitoxin system